MNSATHAALQSAQLINAALGLSGSIHSIAQHVVVPRPDPVIRTDFSNLFQNSTGPSNAFALAQAKASQIALSKNLNLTDYLQNTDNGNSALSNEGNESSRDGE